MDATEQPMKEEWRATHHPNYEVSNLGRVRSMIGPGGRIGRILLRTPRILKGGFSMGYPSVGFWPEVTRYTIHGLVARAFLGPCPVGCEILHKDDNRKNACLDNLEYGTHLQNVLQTATRGRFTQAKLTALEAREIKRVYDSNRTGRSRRVKPGTVQLLVARFGVSDSTIEKIGTGRNWRHVA